MFVELMSTIKYKWGYSISHLPEISSKMAMQVKDHQMNDQNRNSPFILIVHFIATVQWQAICFGFYIK